MPFDWSQYTPPQGATPSQYVAWWEQNYPKIAAARQAYYQQNFYSPETQLRGQYASWAAPAWEGSPQWSQYSGYQGGMQGLLARIGAGPQASDITAAQGDVAQMYGFTPASWTALQESIPTLMNASNVMARAGTIATDLANSPFGQEQTQAMRVAERQATEAVGKQLEAIFGERGGLAGFQAAYEMTSQLQSTFMQQAAQNHLAMFDRSVAAVNAENGYYKDLIDRGAIQAQDYLKLRWDALQTGYTDYAMAMDQTLKEWTVQEQVSQDQWQAAQDNISRQIEALDRQLASEMGFDDNQFDTLQSLYKMYSEPIQAAAEGGSAADFNAFAQDTGTTLLAIGGTVTAVPGLAAVGIGIMLIGGLFKIGGALIDALF